MYEVQLFQVKLSIFTKSKEQMVLSKLDFYVIISVFIVLVDKFKANVAAYIYLVNQWN